MTINQSSNLRPCPFCNMPAASRTSEFDGKEYYSCLDADCPNGSWFTADDWNTRPIEDNLEARIAELEGLVDRLIEIGDRLVFPDGVFDDEQSVIERDWRILTKAVKEREE